MTASPARQLDFRGAIHDSRELMYDTEAIVLLTRDYGESDRLVTLYSEMGGKISGLAKGARRSRRRFVHAFEPFSLVKLTYREKGERVFIEGCRLIEPHLALRADIIRWSYAGLLIEVVLKVAPEAEPQQGLFPLLRQGLLHLGTEKDPLNVLLIFLFRFMHLMGYLPELAGCSSCGLAWEKGGTWWWQMSAGRMVCTRHRDARQDPLRLDAGTLVLIRQIRVLPQERLWRLRFPRHRELSLLRRVVDWIQGYCREEFKSARVIDQVHGHGTVR